MCLHTAQGAIIDKRAPEEGQGALTPGAPSAIPMFWVLHPEETLNAYLFITPEERTKTWRIRKDQLDMTSGGTWERHNWSQEALSARKVISNEFWHIFVRDWPVQRDAIKTHSDTQYTSVLSLALTLMDNVLAACVWIYTKVAMDVNSHKDLERRLPASMESVNLVCEDAFKEAHEWVTQLTISEWEERILVGPALQH